MNIPRLTLLALLPLACLVQARPSSGDDAAVVQVRADGSGDFQTVQEAVNGAPEGAVVRIGEGVWRESVRITRPVTLEGAGWEATRIVPPSADKGQPNPELMEMLGRIASELDSETQEKLRAAMIKVYGTSPVITVNGTDGVILRNMALLRSEPVRAGGFNSNPAVDVVDATVRVAGCAILESPGTGLAARGDSHVKVEKSLIANCWGKGVVVAVSEQGSFEITESDVRNNQYSGLSIGSPSKSIHVTRCRIHGVGWHGIRYDGCSPTIEHNLFYETAVSGIYASGTTAAQVQNNLFYHSGISCWFRNSDAIQSNTFIGDDQADDPGGITQGIQVLGASTPMIRHNILVTCENAVYVGDIGSDGPSSTSSGKVTLFENAFWDNQRNLARYDKQAEEHVALPLPKGNQRQQPEFVDAAHRDFRLQKKSPLAVKEIGARDFPRFDSPWPLQAEEQRTIEAVQERLKQTSGQR